MVIGHNCLIHGCELQSGCLVGMGATVMDGVVVETGAWIGAGSLVTPGKKVKSDEVWMGSPAKFIRKIRDSEKKEISRISNNYKLLAKEYSDIATKDEEIAK